MKKHMVPTLIMSILMLTQQSPIKAQATDTAVFPSINIGTEWLYYDEANNAWYDELGNQIVDATPKTQTTLYDGKQYVVDFEQMTVTAGDGSVNEEFSSLLSQYLSYKAVSYYGIDGKYISPSQGTNSYKADLKRAEEIGKTLPITYLFNGSDKFCCDIYLGSRYLEQIYYSYDAHDYLEIVSAKAVPIIAVSDKYTSIAVGDANMDGKINISDAILTARVVAEDTTAAVSQLGLRLMDMNGDGFKDSADLTMLLKQIAGIKE